MSLEPSNTVTVAARQLYRMLSQRLVSLSYHQQWLSPTVAITSSGYHHRGGSQQQHCFTPDGH